MMFTPFNRKEKIRRQKNNHHHPTTTQNHSSSLSACKWVIIIKVLFAVTRVDAAMGTTMRKKTNFWHTTIVPKYRNNKHVTYKHTNVLRLVDALLFFLGPQRDVTHWEQSAAGSCATTFAHTNREIVNPRDNGVTQPHHCWYCLLIISMCVAVALRFGRKVPEIEWFMWLH